MAIAEKPKASEPGRYTPAEIKRRSDDAWQLRDQWKPILQECYELAGAAVNPYAGNTKTPRPMDRQFDSTAPISVKKLANRILQELTPPDSNWVGLTAGPYLEMSFSEDEIKQLKPDLERTSKIANTVLNAGHAVNARGEAFYDLALAGMGVVLGQDDPENDMEPFIDQAVPQHEVAIEINARGAVCGIYRKRKIKLSQIKKLWDDADIPTDLAGMKNKEKDPEIDILEVSYEGDKKKGNVPWYYEVLWCGKGDPVRLVDRAHDVCPWTIWLWSKLPGIPYGPSPMMLALADVRTANKVMHMLLQNAALALAGMYMVRDDGVVNIDNITITTGGLIPVASTGGSMGASIQPLETGRNFDIGQLVLEQMQNAIKKHLYDNSLPPDRATPKSATEIIQLIKEFNQDFGGGAGRMTADTIQYVRRRLEMLAKRGIIPKMQIDQYVLKIQINSQLVRAQQLAEVENIINWVQMCIQLGGPTLAAVVAKMEDILVYIGERLGVPAMLIRTEAEQQQKMQGQVADQVVMSTPQAAPQLMAHAA